MQAPNANDKPAAPAADLNVDMLSELKSAVDDMRLLLWQYIETASEVNPQRVQEGMDSQRLHRVTKFLQLLRKRLAPSSDEQPVSFIERINAAVTEHLGRDKAA
jgi:flagellar biosynthesis chaperone FliJ